MKNGHTVSSDEMTLMSREDLYLFNEARNILVMRKETIVCTFQLIEVISGTCCCRLLLRFLRIFLQLLYVFS